MNKIKPFLFSIVLLIFGIPTFVRKLNGWKNSDSEDDTKLILIFLMAFIFIGWGIRNILKDKQKKEEIQKVVENFRKLDK